MADRSLAERLSDAVNNITKLEVITRVGDFTVTFTGKADPEVDLTGTAMTGGLFTRIDLIDGDRFNDLTADMLDPQRAELRAFHQQSVTEAQAMIDKRLALVQRIAEWVAGKTGEAADLIHKHANTKPGG